jgi:hypothetical protein
MIMWWLLPTLSMATNQHEYHVSFFHLWLLPQYVLLRNFHKHTFHLPGRDFHLYDLKIRVVNACRPEEMLDKVSSVAVK